MKLKKNNYAALAVIVLYCFANTKSFFYKRFTVLFIVLACLSSSFIFSQETTISGLENIHISEGATIVTENLDNKITVLTSSSIRTYSKEKEGASLKNIGKKSINNKNIAKRAIEKSIKKFEKAPKPTIIIYSNNPEKNSSFQTSNITLKQGTTNSSSNYTSFLNAENNWKILLCNYQSQENILYLFYHSKKINDSLFARPPPIV